MSYLQQIKDLELEIRSNYGSFSDFKIPIIDTIDHTLSRKSQFAVIKNQEIIAISLEKMGLTKIPESIQTMTQLFSLNMGENRIDEIPSWLQNTALKRLYIHDNELNGDLGTSLSIKNLEVLDIAKNKIEDIDLAESKHLKLLYLHTNSLKEVPKLPQSLVYLNLGGNEIKEMLNLDAPNLIDLKFENNKLTEIPDSITKSANLVEIQFRGNQISSISDKINLLHRLQVLNLRENNLNQLPISIGEMHNLRSLDFRANIFEEIPEWIFSFENVKVDFRWNILKKYPDGFVNDTLVIYY